MLLKNKQSVTQTYAGAGLPIVFHVSSSSMKECH